MSWKDWRNNQNSIIILIIMFVMVQAALYGFTCFLEWNETRSGYVLSDFFLTWYPSRNVSVPIFVLTYLGVIAGVGYALRSPQTFYRLLWAALIIVLLRTLSLLLVPLEAPQGIIPLRDFLLEGTFYSGHILQKDLFFSGHTANVFLVSFLTDDKHLKRILFVFACLIGLLLLWQKVHFTIDILAAPVAAYLAFLMAEFVSRRFPINRIAT